MDPFIEDQRWRDFHTTFTTMIREFLIPRVRPRYVIDVEEYVYPSKDSDSYKLIEPDVSIVDRGIRDAPIATDAGSTTLTMEPDVYTLPLPSRIRQPYLNICDKESRKVVTVIELLLPWNKTGGIGQNAYLNKRFNIFATPANLVELDLLRVGERLPTVEPLQSGDYYAFVCRRARIPKVDVYSWTLRQPMPRIPVPLDEDDPDVPLDLQTVFDSTYDRAGYDYRLDYSRRLVPSLDDASTRWLQEQLIKK
jgi:hypothetical protein